MSELRAGTISDAAGTGPVVLTAQYAARSQARYDQTTPTVNQSDNVSSITDVSAGRFTVNFTNAFGDALTRLGGSGDRAPAARALIMATLTSTVPTTSTYTCQTTNDNGTDTDGAYLAVLFWGDLA